MASRVGWVAPADRMSPRDCVALATAADAAGFCGVLAADTFQPWLPSLGQAPFVWNLLSAIGEHTGGDIVAGMAVAGYRLHPAVLAQAAATLAALHHGRVWISLAPGESIHEHITGLHIPEAPERIDRMFEALELVQKLFSASRDAKSTRFHGAHFTMEAARVWTMPPTLPQIVIATSGPTTARRAGRVADGIMVLGTSVSRAEALLDRFRDGAEASGRDADSLRRVAYMNVSWAPDRTAARQAALARFPMAAMRFAHGDLRSPHTIEQIARLVRAEDLGDGVLVTDDAGEIRAAIASLLGAGFQQVYLNNVADNHAEFLHMAVDSLLPQ
ncbi:MAG: LLM class flavin-dependent oxidoreductase [Actinobacteria bacterium]|nr:LLM class flavin-dependent oxidoreductase [Actinomycetota bacterium]